MRPVVVAARRALRLVLRFAAWRRVFRRVVSEVTAALEDEAYGARYFGTARVSGDGLSGYVRYDRASSNADVAAYLLWRHFDARRALDVGCATGFVVATLRDLGMDAVGIDISAWAVEHADPGAAGHVRRQDIARARLRRGATYDLVSVFETLEHLRPEAVPRALRNLRRLAAGHVVATIPSFGPNEHGPGGWFQQKVRDDRLAHYAALGAGYDGPVPYVDLYRDAAGDPIEGHLTIASFRWWTSQWERAGFVRCGRLERRMHLDLARFGLTKYWNLYVFRVPHVAESPGDVRDAQRIASVEQRLGLIDRVADEDDLARVRHALGP